jgi:isoleucyl-tRNA synthetase
VLAEELNVRAVEELAHDPPVNWAVATDGRLCVALDVRITPDLRHAGLARYVIRVIQDARRQHGLAFSDRINVRCDCADPDVALAVTRHQSLISAEVGPPNSAPGRRATPARSAVCRSNRGWA